MRRRSAGYAVSGLLAVIVLLLAAGGCGGTGESVDGLPKTLRVGIIPNISPEKQRAQYEPLREHLTGILGVEVELFVANNYAGVVAALVAKQVDVAYLGGLTYAQAVEQSSGITPLVTEIDEETGTPRYYAAVVVPAASAAKTVQDVVAAKGRFAFGDVSSTSGSLYPRMMITEAGAQCRADELDVCPPLRTVTFTGGHDATAQAVFTGAVEAGGLELRILHRLERQGTIPAGALRVVGQREVMGYPWVARDGLDAAARQKVTDAFTGITDPELLALMRAKSYVTVSPGDYTEVRENATRLGLVTVR
ncbi:phosphate/phosphite/phosphonate ABC transporter substrate-binding protein [Plantactinospora solaniradicis]|uniref:Phosphate/phosphite/phosphonate ABC transporter substrate-binding protein n=1 Tax=Plantactinospora solaniradicis TaxID=1723736 RepID=A0ABW1KEZ6_9ACTN